MVRLINTEFICKQKNISRLDIKNGDDSRVIGIEVPNKSSLDRAYCLENNLTYLVNLIDLKFLKKKRSLNINLFVITL